MFYSDRSSAISSDKSHIEFDRIFCGQYWDEYGCVGLLGPFGRPSSVLMLGLGDGAAIRPILASGKVRQLTCVDSDESCIARCRRIYAENFPLIEFRTVQAEALEYLSKSTEQFDVIVVDLYTHVQYAPVVFADNFQDLLSERLHQSGHIVCNAYGIPTHLRPFEGSSPQAFLARRFHERWGSVFYLPYRRNVTLIVGHNLRPEIDMGVQFSGLRLGDRLALELIRFRLQSILEVELDDAEFSLDLTRHSEIDSEMRRRWLEIVPVLDSYLAPEFRVESPVDLIRLLERDALCANLLTKLAAEDHRLLSVLPSLVAGEINNRDIDASWLLDWTLDFLSDMRSPGRQRFFDYCLAQVFSVAINGRNRHRSAVFLFKEHIEGLLCSPVP